MFRHPSTPADTVENRWQEIFRLFWQKNPAEFSGHIFWPTFPAYFSGQMFRPHLPAKISGT